MRWFLLRSLEVRYRNTGCRKAPSLLRMERFLSPGTSAEEQGASIIEQLAFVEGLLLVGGY